MWTDEHRRAAGRRGRRYPSDMTDAEWALVAPMIPPAKRGGRRRAVDVREVLNAIFYVLWTGCQWKALPKDFPPKSTVYDYLDLWEWDGTLERLHHALYVQERERQGREASPTVAISDSLRKARRATARRRGSPTILPTSWISGLPAAASLARPRSVSSGPFPLRASPIGPSCCAAPPPSP